MTGQPALGEKYAHAPIALPSRHSHRPTRGAKELENRREAPRARASAPRREWVLWFVLNKLLSQKKCAREKKNYAPDYLPPSAPP